MAYRPVTDVPDRQSHSQAESDAHIEGNLATEVSLVILDTLEQIVQVSTLSSLIFCTPLQLKESRLFIFEGYKKEKSILCIYYNNPPPLMFFIISTSRQQYILPLHMPTDLIMKY